jgi:hypothetical protein
LLSLHGEKQSDGTMLYIKASDLSTGSAITVESLSSLTSGTLLDMSTTTTSGHVDGLVRLTATEMTTGVGMKINTKDLTTGKGLHITSGTGTTLNETTHLLYIEGNAELNGNIVEISARDMSNGTVLKLTGGNSLSSGKMLDLYTGSTELTNGAFEITANTLETGHILRISGNGMTNANMIDLLTSSTGITDANGKIINMDIRDAKNGTMIDVKAPELDDGTILLLTSAKLKTGKILDLSDNADLTIGKLLHMKTTSAVTANPILIELEEMTTGIGMQVDYEDLTTGTGLLIDSRNGNSLSTTIVVAKTVVNIAGSAVTSDGVYSVTNGTGTIASYEENDIVRISGCSNPSSLKNNGDFKISVIDTSANPNTIKLVSMYDNMPIVTGTVEADCNISKFADGTDIPIGVITIVSVTDDGKYTTQAGTGSISEYTEGDIVTIQSCSVGGGDKNGEFKISVRIINNGDFKFAIFITATNTTTLNSYYITTCKRYIALFTW